MAIRPALTRFGAGLRLFFRRLVILLLSLIILLLILYIFRAPLLTQAGEYLVVSDSLSKADLIYMMGGELNTRPLRTAQLYRAGYAPKVAIPTGMVSTAERMGVRPNIAVESAFMLQRLGVPQSAIVLIGVPGGSTSTLHDAEILAGYVKRHRLQSVIVVTSEFHTRRTRWALRKTAARLLPDQPLDVRMVPADDPRYAPDDWWQSEPGMMDSVSEFIKFVHNFTHLKRW
jgi:uncharacterized SAM-binding protein YcdF (DUF218 family)